jgi:hypothetical protein
VSLYIISGYILFDILFRNSDKSPIKKAEEMQKKAMEEAYKKAMSNHF